MTRPPLIRTDIADLPSLGLLLLAAGCHLHVRLLPVAAVDVDALQLCERLPRVRVVRRADRSLLDHPVGLRDLRSLRDRRRRHEPDTARIRPDEGIDLVHLPRLMTVPER